MNTASKNFLVFLLKFLGLFLIFYFGSLAMIGLAAPGGLYSPFVEKYLDFVRALQFSLIRGSQLVMWVLGYDTDRTDRFVYYVVGGRGVIVNYGCAGLGVMSFWSAYMLAVNGRLKRRLVWLFSGLILIWIINVLRITMVLFSLQKGWPMLFGLDHHTLFNIVAYGAIFILIYFFERRSRIEVPETDTSL